MACICYGVQTFQGLVLLNSREVFTVAQICRSVVQKSSGTIKKLQHSPAADPSGWVWSRCWLRWQRRNTAPLSLWDHIMPWRPGTGLLRPGLRTWTVRPLLQQTVCGLPFQWYDTFRCHKFVIVNEPEGIVTPHPLVPRYCSSRSQRHRPFVPLHPPFRWSASRHRGHNHNDWSQQRCILHATQRIFQPRNHNWTSAWVCRFWLGWDLYWFPTSLRRVSGVQSREQAEHRVAPGVRL